MERIIGTRIAKSITILKLSVSATKIKGFGWQGIVATPFIQFSQAERERLPQDRAINQQEI
jgi:hypothetical protein